MFQLHRMMVSVWKDTRIPECYTCCILSILCQKSTSIDDVYVVGISITYENAPHKQIWAFINGFDDLRFHPPSPHVCPCYNMKYNAQVLIRDRDRCSYIYLCCTNQYHLYPTDPLRDGQQCATPTCHGFSRHSMRPPLRI